jgi:hypothetical protein
MNYTNCLNDDVVIKVGVDILKVFKDCFDDKNKNMYSCIKDIETLDCKDIDNIIKLYVLISKAKKDGTYEKTRNEILEIFKTFKIMDIKNFVKKFLEPLINSLDKFDCLIDDINKEFQLNENEKIDLSDIKQIKNDLMTLRTVREGYSGSSNNGHSNTFLIIMLSIIGFLILIGIILFLKNRVL